MNNKTKSILISSIFLNVLCFLLLSVMAFKSWSPADFKNKTISIFSQQKPSIPSYYLEKTDQFKKLNINSNDIVFIGDSITDMGEWSEIFNNPHVKNRGINSDNIKGVAYRIEDVLKGKPKSIFLMIGTNDLFGNSDIPSMVSEYDKILKTIKDTSPNTKIYVQSVLPISSKYWGNSVNTALRNRKQDNNTIKEFNSQIEELAKKENTEYINLFDEFTDSNGNLNMKLSDEGLHLNGEGYMLWKQNIEKYINTQ